MCSQCPLQARDSQGLAAFFPDRALETSNNSGFRV